MPPWTRDHISKLSEDELTKAVLIPLFRAMGYQDVRYHGGGALEQGKDVTMWRADPVRERIDIAVVVKATPITGETTTGTVITQIKQAFGKPYLDTAEATPRIVRECIVVTPHTIKKEGTNTLESLLANEQLGRSVTFIDGQRLWELIEQYLGDRILLSRLTNAGEELRNAIGEDDLTIHLDGKTTTITASRQQANPISVTPRFPNTPEGEQHKERFEHFLKTGEPTTLPITMIEGLPIPGIAEKLGFDTSAGIAKLSTKSRTPLAGTLRLTSPDEEPVEITHIEFHSTAGSEQLCLTNNHQNIPFHITTTITFGPPPTGTLEYETRAIGWSAHWLHTTQRAFHLMSKGCRLNFQDHTSGIDYPLASVGPKPKLAPSKEFLDATRRLAWIEEQLKQPILIPNREFFTGDDLEELELVQTIITTGQHRLTNMNFTIVPNSRVDVRHWLAPSTKEHTTLDISLPFYTRSLLDNRLELGPVTLHGAHVLTQCDTPLDEAITKAARGEPIKITITPALKGRLVIRFKNWEHNRAASPRRS